MIAETFQVRAPIERVWQYLTDPRQVVACLPGAELIEPSNDGTFAGRVKVKVGPVGASFKGRARFTEMNESAHLVRMTAEGHEAAGGGSAKMTMTSTMTALPDGATEVTVEASVDIVGKLMQFGRGMIEDVSKQLFRQFAICVRSTLESSPGDRGDARGATVASTASGSGSPAVGASSASSAGASHAEASTSTRDVPPAGTPPSQARPISVLPLFFRAGWRAITRLFGRAT